MPKLVGCIILNNEIQLLKDRLEYEYNKFSQIIITEARQLFNGNDKPLYFEKYQDEFRAYFPKIVYDVVDSLPLPVKGRYIGTNNREAGENRWPAEAAMRNHFLKYINYFNDDDIFLIQDCDEIANMEFVHAAIPHLQSEVLTVLRLRYHWFVGGILHSDLQNKIWNMGYLTSGAVLKDGGCKYTPHILRTAYLNHNQQWISWTEVCPACLRRIDNSPVSLPVDLSKLRIVEQNNSHPQVYGWHLSSMYCRSESLIDLKTSTFSHAECINEISSTYFPDIEEPVALLRKHAKSRELPAELSISEHAPSFLLNSEKLPFYA